jgi:hypothetical protein
MNDYLPWVVSLGIVSATGTVIYVVRSVIRSGRGISISGQAPGVSIGLEIPPLPKDTPPEPERHRKKKQAKRPKGRTSRGTPVGSTRISCPDRQSEPTESETTD